MIAEGGNKKREFLFLDLKRALSELVGEKGRYREEPMGMS